MKERLTKAQRDVLEFIGSCPSGVVDITDERAVRKLVDRDLVFKFFETREGAEELRPVWTITSIGRAALLKALEDGKP